jgi:hypothetical protein
MRSSSIEDMPSGRIVSEVAITLVSTKVEANE